MSDFNDDFWSVYISVITVASILACAVLLWTLSTKRVVQGKSAEVMGHVWDEDLEEYNNPLPRWWIWLFYITIWFSVAYLFLYPGLGSYAGYFNWTSRGEYEADQVKAREIYQPIYAKYAAMSVPDLARDTQAREMGQRLFLNHCATCHASDARGGKGYPNLTDRDWLYGGDPETITATITNGRMGLMPALGAVIGEDGVKATTHYVLSLSGLAHDKLHAETGRKLFVTNCAVCHGAEGKGNQSFGAPNLTDNVWLYGAGETTIAETIGKGRPNQMPAWGEFLGEEKTHVLAAYVWGLSNAK